MVKESLDDSALAVAPGLMSKDAAFQLAVVSDPGVSPFAGFFRAETKGDYLEIEGAVPSSLVYLQVLTMGREIFGNVLPPHLITDDRLRDPMKKLKPVCHNP